MSIQNKSKQRKMSHINEKNVFYLSNLSAAMFGSAENFEFKLKQHIIFALYTNSDILFHCNIFDFEL